jgi:hypothetical protein
MPKNVLIKILICFSLQCNDVRCRHVGNNLSKHNLYHTNTELRTLWWTIAVSLLACVERYCVSETPQRERHCVVTSGLSDSDFSCLWITIRVIPTSEHVAYIYMQGLFLFIFRATWWRLWKPPVYRLHSSSCTCNISNISIYVAQLRRGISGFTNGRHVSWPIAKIRLIFF